MASSKRADNGQTSTNDALRDDVVTSSEVEKTVPVDHTSDESHIDAQSRNEGEARPKRGEEVQTPVEHSQSPEENDSGVNVEDDDATTAEQHRSNHAVHVPPITVAVDTTPSSYNGDGNNSLNVTPPNDDLMSSRSRHHADHDKLSVPKSPSNFPDSGRRRNSILDVRDPEKPRLVALAQRGEWSVLDQVLRAMDRSTFYEINLADEV